MLVALIGLSFAGGCRWFAGKRLTEAERREMQGRFRRAVEGAGGSQIWVKDARSSAAADSPIEVLAVSPVFEAALSAFQREAARSGLQVEVKLGRSKGRGRVADTRIFTRGELLGRWRLREVSRLHRAAIILDDLGQDRAAARKLLELPYPLTFSVLPHLSHSIETAEEAHRAGREVMLHLPMETEPGARVTPGPGELRVGMSSVEVATVIEQDLAAVPYSVGVNNHMGSRATADSALMARVMKVLGNHRLYFVDSRTTGSSVGLDLARREGLPAFYRSVFLDDMETVPYTLRQLREFRRVVEEQGVALAIGHPHATTIAALVQFLPELERDDICLVPVSQLVRLPEVAGLRPHSHEAP